MAINTVKTVTVFVSDQDRARDFYVDALGLEVKVDQTFGDNRWLEVGAPAAKSKIKIPDAANAHGISTITPYQMLRQHGVYF